MDAGGMGFVIILQGMLDVLNGVKVETVIPAESSQPREAADFSEYATEDIKFAYCTEFIVSRSTKRDPAKLRTFLSTLGDSLVLVDDEEIIKVHVHTNNPGRALEEAIKYGMLATVKVENMRQQHTEKVVDQKEAPAAVRVSAAPERKYGFVSVCSGEGISAVFKDLGVDNIIAGGQTMNPSTQDILSQIDKTPSEVVFVFPNNKNIIMAAEQCVPLSGKTVIVMPTKTIPQGISAMLAFDPALEAEQNRETMMSAISRVRTGQITYAARDSDFDGKKIREGDYLCLLEGQLFGNAKDLSGLSKRLAREFQKAAASFITIFYGEGVSEQDADKLRAVFEKECKNAEISVLFGGQAVYYYLISAE